MTQYFVDFEGPADGTTCTAANLLATTRGGLSGTWSVDGAGADMKFEADATRGLLYHGGPLADDTVILPDAGTLGVQYLTATGTSYIVLHLAGVGNSIAGDNCSAGVWIKTNLLDNDTSNIDLFTIYALSGTNFVNAKQRIAGSGLVRCFELEAGAGGGPPSGVVDTPTATWYWVTLLYRKTGNHEIQIWSEAGALVGSITSASNGVAKPSYIAIGQASSNTPTTGYYVNFDSLLIDTDATWPLMPGATGDFLRLNQTANTDPVTELWKRAAAPSTAPTEEIIQHSGDYPTHPDLDYVYAKHGTPQKHVYVFEGTLDLATATAARP